MLETLPLSGWAAGSDIAFVLLDASICRSSDLEKGRNPEVREGRWNILRHIARANSFDAVTPRVSSGSTPMFKTESPVQELFNQKHGLSFDSLQQLQQCARHRLWKHENMIKHATRAWDILITHDNSCQANGMFAFPRGSTCTEGSIVGPPVEQCGQLEKIDKNAFPCIFFYA